MAGFNGCNLCAHLQIVACVDVTDRAVVGLDAAS